MRAGPGRDAAASTARIDQRGGLERQVGIECPQAGRGGGGVQGAGLGRLTPAAGVPAVFQGAQSGDVAGRLEVAVPRRVDEGLPEEGRRSGPGDTLAVPVLLLDRDELVVDGMDVELWH